MLLSESQWRKATVLDWNTRACWHLQSFWPRLQPRSRYKTSSCHYLWQEPTTQQWASRKAVVRLSQRDRVSRHIATHPTGMRRRCHKGCVHQFARDVFCGVTVERRAHHRISITRNSMALSGERSERLRYRLARSRSAYQDRLERDHTKRPWYFDQAANNLHGTWESRHLRRVLHAVRLDFRLCSCWQGCRQQTGKVRI